MDTAVPAAEQLPRYHPRQQEALGRMSSSMPMDWAGVGLCGQDRPEGSSGSSLPVTLSPEPARKCLLATTSDCQKDSKQLQDKQRPVPSGGQEVVNCGQCGSPEKRR